MNKQDPGIEWTHIPLSDGARLPGYTWNPIGGCQHDCEWIVDGVRAQCYAKTIAERFPSAYPHGFAHHYWRPHLLDDPILEKKPCGIFIDSMSDLFGSWVPEDQIRSVLDVCRQVYWHTFIVLTKNAPRLLKFKFPPNVWVLVSTPPDYMFGKRLSREQQENMLDAALKVLSALKLNGQARIVGLSAEPLSWDVSPYLYLDLDWIIVGAASSGKSISQPEPAHVRAVVEYADRWDIPVFFKGNLMGNAAVDEWREAFPVIEPSRALLIEEMAQERRQLSLF